MERWVFIETADRKQLAWCKHGEYRRKVFGPVNVKRKRARLLDHITSNCLGLLSKRFLIQQSEIIARHFNNLPLKGSLREKDHGIKRR